MERKYPKKRPTVVDLFCGAGGMSLGFEQAGFDVILGVDRDGHHVATHERNFPNGKALCTSVADLDASKVRSLLPEGTEIDVVVGGPPCQGFSNMGLRDLKDPRNSLIDHYVRLLLELRPKAFVMENVPGLLAGETRQILDKLISTVEENGYRVASPVRILDASGFGVPQKRRRVFVIGMRTDVSSEVEYPSGPCDGQPARPNVWQAISDLPNIENHEYLFSVNNAPYSKQPRNEYASAARGFLDDPSDLSIPRVWNTDTCTGCLRTKHQPKSVALYNATPPGDTVPGHKLPRLDPKGLCPTLRAGSDSTHGSYTAPRPIHPKRPRCITAREAARLHGFPDWFALYPLKWHAYRQVGNAVCPPVARAIGQSILKALAVPTTKRKPKAIVLGETFILPDDRPRTLKRIPVLKEFPPVVDCLFKDAFDPGRKRLRKPAFTFADVERAIRETGANLPWVREDSFLGELARSRQLKKILRSVHEKGYSIQPSVEGNVIGRFVPLGTPGTLEDRQTLQLRIDTLHEAIPVRWKGAALNGDGETAIKFLSRKVVQDAVWGASKPKFRLKQSEHFNGGSSSFLLQAVGRVDPQPNLASVVVCKTKAIPDKARVARIAKQHGSDTVMLLVRATDFHVVAIRFDDCQSAPTEQVRVAFKLKP